MFLLGNNPFLSRQKGEGVDVDVVTGVVEVEEDESQSILKETSLWVSSKQYIFFN